MPSLTTVTAVPSKKYAGVVFHVRTLNVIQRAIRDSEISEHRHEHSRLLTERAVQFEALVGKTGTPEERTVRANLLPPDSKAAILNLDEAAELIFNQHIAPATIRKALASIDGYEIDGAPATAELMILHAPDDLLRECFEACERGSGLTEEQAKN